MLGGNRLQRFMGWCAKQGYPIIMVSMLSICPAFGSISFPMRVANPHHLFEIADSMRRDVKDIFFIESAIFDLGKITIVTSFVGRDDEKVMTDLVRPELDPGRMGIGYGDLFLGEIKGGAFVPTLALSIDSQHGLGGRCSAYTAEYWLRSEDYLSLDPDDTAYAASRCLGCSKQRIPGVLGERGKKAGWRAGYPVSLVEGKQINLPCKWWISLPSADGVKSDIPYRGRAIVFEVDWLFLRDKYKVSAISWTMYSAHDAIQVELPKD